MLLQVVMVFALLAGVLASFNHQYQNIGYSAKRAQIKSALISNKKFLLSAMQLEYIWEKTIAFNQNSSAFNCINNPASACSSNSEFQLIDAAGNPMTERVNQNPGLTYSGEMCVGFDRINGNNDCPIGLTLSFERICSASCSDPLMKIFIEFEHKVPLDKMPLNMSQFKAEFVRSPYSNNVLAHKAIYSADPGYNFQLPGLPTHFTNKDISETFTIEEDGVLTVTVSSKIQMQPNGPGETDKIHIHNSALMLNINGTMVAQSKSTTITNSELGVGSDAECSRYVSWIQNVSKGTISLDLKMAGWIEVVDPSFTVAYPKVIFTNLAYTVLK